MKKIISLIVSLILLLGIIPSIAETVPEYKNVKIIVNGEKVILLNSEDEQQKSLIIDNQVYVPFEAFITAIGGEYTYDETANQIVINLQSSGTSATKAEETSETPANGGNSDRDIASILTMGRWTKSLQNGKVFFDFYENYKGLASGLIDFDWSVNNGVISLHYFSQGKEYNPDFTLEIADGKYQLNGAAGIFILNAGLENKDILIGKWTAANDDTAILTFFADATFELKMNGQTFSGNWLINKEQTEFRLYQSNNVAIMGTINGENIALNVDGRYINFKR